MAPRRKEIASELVAEGRRLYEQTVVPVGDIARKMGISKSTLQNRVDAWSWKRRDYHSELMRKLRAAEVAAAQVSAPASEQPTSEPPAAPPVPADRVAIAARIATVVERELDAVERVLKVIGPNNQVEAERSARTLASIGRALREIAAFNESHEVTPDDADDDAVPRDIDEFRNELARRINEFVDARRSGTDGADG